MSRDGNGEGLRYSLNTTRHLLLCEAKRGLFDRIRSVTWLHMGHPTPNPIKLSLARAEAFENYRQQVDRIQECCPRDGAR